MSEDAAPRPTQWADVATRIVTIVADGAESAALLDVVGCPANAVGLDHAPIADILVVDWRFAVDDLPKSIAIDCGLLALVGLETIDAADAAMTGRNARFVFGGSGPLIATELSDLMAMIASRHAHDPSGNERARLQSLAQELARLAEQLGALSDPDVGDHGGSAIADPSLAYHAEQLEEPIQAKPPGARSVRQLIAMRRLRDRFFPADLFADPAWDILLDLSASRLEARSVSVSSLCIAAAVPPTTALRWIRMMTDQGLLERRADPADARRMFVDLSAAAFAGVCSWFSLVEQRGGLGV